MSKFAGITLTRPELTLDAVHDGRHALSTAIANDRESIPLLAHLPEEGIAFFTYTWVNAASEAGAAVCLFGPGVGPEPIVIGLPDRPVPADMNFSEWKIEGFEMKHDLQFGTARFHFADDRVALDFTFEGAHPPYAYAGSAGGCPSYCATNRIEQSGRVWGTLTLAGRTIAFDTTGHRDHSWGTRDWKAMQNYRWFQGQAGPGVSVHFWHLNALGQTRLIGYVFKDGVMAEVTGLDFDLAFDDRFLQRSLTATITDDAGRTTSLAAEFYAHAPLIPSPDLVLNEAAATITVDGKPGVGWLECAWPTDYLAHIRANPAYAQG
ncbi:DUF7064 domain-containing protein [Novosphingobium colocasiae]|uniref:AttH domain-containing protein n=1 Tax=Novosphingobium colocasiae TaxID=1256513 RepID=A0A918UC29_9SPHN|nr:hypothetical protein [Novosphingobium colocasiae]GGY90045.1 hypothetical protein GCM10011614_00810 [Novosphingobium colocasiae]